MVASPSTTTISRQAGKHKPAQSSTSNKTPGDGTGVQDKSPLCWHNVCYFPRAVENRRSLGVVGALAHEDHAAAP